MDLAGLEFLLKFFTALAAGNHFTPGLRGQTIFRCRRPVPTLAFGDVAHALGNSRRQRHCRCQESRRLCAGIAEDGMANRRINVAVGIITKQPPDGALRFEGDGALVLGGVEQEGNDGIAGDVAGDVLLGVVGAHLLLVDVFLEDVAENVGIDFVVSTQRALVEVPLVGVEEAEDLLEGGVRDLNVGILLLQFVHIEQAAVEIGNRTKQLIEVLLAVGGWLAQPFMKEPDQEIAVERQELIPASFGLNATKAIAKVVQVAVEESLLLDEVDEHQPVKHERGVPLGVGHGRDALDELEERGVLRFEAVVELLGNPVHVECLANAAQNIRQRGFFFLVQADLQVFQFLGKQFSRVPLEEIVFAPCQRPAEFTPHPLPFLKILFSVGVNDNVLMGRLADLAFNLAAGRMIGKRTVERRALEHLEAAFLRHGKQAIGQSVHDDAQSCWQLVPAKFAEQAAEVELLKAAPKASNVQRHGSISSPVV